MYTFFGRHLIWSTNRSTGKNLDTICGIQVFNFIGHGVHGENELTLGDENNSLAYVGSGLLKLAAILDLKLKDTLNFVSCHCLLNTALLFF